MEISDERRDTCGPDRPIALRDAISSAWHGNRLDARRCPVVYPAP
ncbi:hypothetical protein N8342_04035 [Acidimicrobiales bacterium]|nr:hypothetical protein [Acidimicrobiales bacterium]